MKEVLYGRAFPQKLRIVTNGKILPGFLSASLFQRWCGDLVRCARQDRTAQHDTMKCILGAQRLSNVSADALDSREVQFSVTLARCSHADKGDFGLVYC